jgi:predicted RecA/RadA family phage recombinase
MKNLIAQVVGGDAAGTITITAGGTYTSGTPVAIGGLVGIPEHDAVSGDLVTLRVHGVVRVPKNTGGGTDHAVGDRLSWDGGNGYVIDYAVGATQMGLCVKAASTADTHVEIMLTPGSIVDTNT